MPYIPKEHEKYDLLPLCRKDGGETWEYPDKLINEVEGILVNESGLFPYNYDSYEQYESFIDALVEKYKGSSKAVEKLNELRIAVRKMNQKEEWSICKYLGLSDDGLGLTHGKNYYWPTRKENPVYCGVVDDEEFTSYWYPTEAHMWEILEDPTGMAYRTIYEKAKGYTSVAQHEAVMEQIEQQFKKE